MWAEQYSLKDITNSPPARVLLRKTRNKWHRREYQLQNIQMPKYPQTNNRFAIGKAGGLKTCMRFKIRLCSPQADTVRAGNFTVKCFVPPRTFHGEIHAITKTRDLDGQEIDRNAMQTTKDGYQNGRWLIHDK